MFVCHSLQYPALKMYVVVPELVSTSLGGGYSQIKWVKVCGPLFKTLTLFMTKVWDFSYPLYVLTKTLMSYFWPLLLAQLAIYNLWRAVVDYLIDDDEKVASFKKHKLYLIYRVYDKNGWKTIPFAAACSYIHVAYIC